MRLRPVKAITRNYEYLFVWILCAFGKTERGAMRNTYRKFFGGAFLCALTMGSVNAYSQTIQFDVPQQSADSALNELASQADITVVFVYESVSKYQTNYLKGTYSIPEAIALLLAETPLKYEFREADQLVITLDNLVEESEQEPPTGNIFATALNALFGEQTRSQQDPREQTDEPRFLEEIVVTARKREESIYDVPVAISAFTERGLESEGIDNIEELLNATPGAIYSDINGNRATASLGVRGISGLNSVSTFIDGMPMIGSQAAINYVDVESVEIYRGPQSAVFGRSVFAGAINYNTRTPSVTETEGGINAQYGEDSRRAIRGWISIPIVQDTLAVSISGAYDSYGGPNEIKSSDEYDMGTADTEHYSAALAFEPNDQVSVSLRYERTEIDDGSAADYNLNPALYPEQYQEAAANYDENGERIAEANFAPLFFGEVQIEDTPVLRRNFCYNEGEVDQNCIRDPGWELERERLAFDAGYDLANGQNLTFKAFTKTDYSFDHDDQDNTDEAFGAMSVVNMGIETDIEEDYYEILWTSPDEDRLRYTLGYSVYKYKSEIARYFVHPVATLTGLPNGEQGSTASAPGIVLSDVSNSGVFGGVFYDFTEKLTGSFEARQQKDKIAAGGLDGAQVVTNSFLPRVSLQYAHSDDLNFYAQYSEGAKPATLNTEAFNSTQIAVAEGLDGLVVDGVTLESAVPFLESVRSVDEEQLKNYEIGMKGRFLDNRMSVEAALFLIQTDSFAEPRNFFFAPDGVNLNRLIEELALQNPGVPELQSNLTDTSFRVRGSLNTGDLESRGLEFAATYLLDSNWSLSGQLTYLDSIFAEGCDFAGSIFGIADSEFLPPGASETIPCTDVSGNRATFVPEYQLSSSVAYEADLNNGISWFFRLSGRYEDEQYIDNFNNGILPSSLKFNLRTGFSNERYRVEAYIENLTDNNVPAGAQYEADRKEVANFFGTSPPAGSTGINIATAKPREVGLRASIIF